MLKIGSKNDLKEARTRLYIGRGRGNGWLRLLGFYLRARKFNEG